MFPGAQCKHFISPRYHSTDCLLCNDALDRPAATHYVGKRCKSSKPALPVWRLLFPGDRREIRILHELQSGRFWSGLIKCQSWPQFCLLSLYVSELDVKPWTCAYPRRTLCNKQQKSTLKFHFQSLLLFKSNGSVNLITSLSGVNTAGVNINIPFHNTYTRSSVYVCILGIKLVL